MMRWKTASPLVLLTAVWLFIFVVRELPVIGYQPIDGITTAYLITCYIVFLLSYESSKFFYSASCKRPQIQIRSNLVVERIIHVSIIFSVIGLIGAAMRAVDIYFLRGLNFADGLGAARLSNIEQVQSLGQGNSPLAGIGRMMAACSTISAMVVFLYWEKVPVKKIKIVMAIFILVLLQSILEGGRNTILVNLSFVASCAFVRRHQGKPVLPGGRGLRQGLVLLISAVLILFVYVFIDRFASLGYPTHLVVNGLERGFNIEINPILVDWEGEIATNVAIGLISLLIYLTHTVNELQWLVGWVLLHPLAHGAYNFDLIAVSLQRLGIPNLVFDPQTLDRPGVYMTALGEFAIDFGLSGAVAICALLGAWIGFLWAKAKRKSTIGVELGLGIGISALLLSPFYSIVPGFLGTLVSAFLFVFLVRMGRLPRSHASNLVAK